MKKTFNQTMPCAVRLAALLLVPAVCVAFSGCSAVPGSSGSSAAEPSPSPAAAEPAAKPDLPSLRPLCQGDENGYYTFMTAASGDYQQVLYADYQTGTQAPACHITGCTHDSPSCPACFFTGVPVTLPCPVGDGTYLSFVYGYDSDGMSIVRLNQDYGVEQVLYHCNYISSFYCCTDGSSLWFSTCPSGDSYDRIKRLDLSTGGITTLFDAGEDFLKRYSHHIKEALKEFTHFGMDGGLSFAQEHEVLDREEFRMTELLRGLHGKAVRQLGSSGGGNHFVEFGKMSLQAGNVLGVPEGNYVALLSHSGSRGLGAAIAKHYSLLARDLCRLPREAQHFAWLGLDTEEGQEYWLSMNLAGDYACACHERIHLNLSKALGLKPLANMNNHHNFAWKEEIAPGQTAIVHRKGATPAQKGQPGLIPGSMATPGYLVCGKGISEALCSASHGAGRAMSRQKAKDNFTRSALRKYLSQAGVTLIGGSVEEMPLAYKDIDRVMKTQEELVEVQGTFMPCIVRMNKE